jgi:hypothetical protein
MLELGIGEVKSEWGFPNPHLPTPNPHNGA